MLVAVRNCPLTANSRSTVASPQDGGGKRPSLNGASRSQASARCPVAPSGSSGRLGQSRYTRCGPCFWAGFVSGGGTNSAQKQKWDDADPEAVDQVAYGVRSGVVVRPSPVQILSAPELAHPARHRPRCVNNWPSVGRTGWPPTCGQTATRYVYVAGNPVTLSDPIGLDPGCPHDNARCNDAGHYTCGPSGGCAAKGGTTCSNWTHVKGLGPRGISEARPSKEPPTLDVPAPPRPKPTGPEAAACDHAGAGAGVNCFGPGR